MHSQTDKAHSYKVLLRKCYKLIKLIATKSYYNSVTNWSSGYGKSWVWITAPDTRWIIFYFNSWKIEFMFETWIENEMRKRPGRYRPIKNKIVLQTCIEQNYITITWSNWHRNHAFWTLQIEPILQCFVFVIKYKHN